MPSITENARDYFVRCKHITQIDPSKPYRQESMDAILENPTDAVLVIDTLWEDSAIKAVTCAAKKTDKPVYLMSASCARNIYPSKIPSLLDDNILEGLLLQRIIGRKRIFGKVMENEYYIGSKRFGIPANAKFDVGYTSGKPRVMPAIRKCKIGILYLIGDALNDRQLESVREAYNGHLIVDANSNSYESAIFALKKGADAIVVKAPRNERAVEGYQRTIKAAKRN